MPPPRSAPEQPRPRIGYLGPRGTISDEALHGAVREDAASPMPYETLREAVLAVRDGAVRFALVPIENSVEGPVTVTLDTLAAEAPRVAIVGELVLAVHHFLIARTSGVALERIETVLSHPQASGQCSIFLRRELPHARVAAATSTAEAVRAVVQEGTDAQVSAAIGTRLAAEIYGGAVLRERIEDRHDNETRFTWIARAEDDPAALPLRSPPNPAGHGKTSIVFWGPGAEHAGWLVDCLQGFAKRGINLTKIESRPRRERLGNYMFFADLQGRVGDGPVDEALADLRSLCEEVRVLGSYAVA
jgi:prephenate dehydratase